MGNKKLMAFTVTAVALTAAGAAVIATNPRRVAEAEESLRLATAAKAEELASQVTVKSQFAVEANCGGKKTAKVLELDPDEITGSLIVNTMNDESLTGCTFAGVSTQHLLIQGPETGDIPLTGTGFGLAAAHVEVSDTGEEVEVAVSSAAKVGLFRSAISAEAHASHSLAEDAQRISTGMMQAYTEAAPIIQRQSSQKTITQVVVPPARRETATEETVLIEPPTETAAEASPEPTPESLTSPADTAPMDQDPAASEPASLPVNEASESDQDDAVTPEPLPGE